MIVGHPLNEQIHNVAGDGLECVGHPSEDLPVRIERFLLFFFQVYSNMADIRATDGKTDRRAKCLCSFLKYFFALFSEADLCGRGGGGKGKGRIQPRHFFSEKNVTYGNSRS